AGSGGWAAGGRTRPGKPRAAAAHWPFRAGRRGSADAGRMPGVNSTARRGYRRIVPTSIMAPTQASDGAHMNAMTKRSRTNDAAMTTERDPRWAAVLARDTAADGQFWYSVRTTGVYC